MKYEFKAPLLPWDEVLSSSQGIKKDSSKKAVAFGYDYWIHQKTNGRWAGYAGYEGSRQENFETEQDAMDFCQHLWGNIWKDNMSKMHFEAIKVLAEFYSSPAHRVNVPDKIDITNPLHILGSIWRAEEGGAEKSNEAAISFAIKGY